MQKVGLVDGEVLERVLGRLTEECVWYKYFRIERTDVVKYAVTFNRYCMVDANFIMDCFDLDTVNDNQLVAGSSKSGRQYDLGVHFDKSDPSSLKVVASNNLVCVFQHYKAGV